jgi:hypothetical protein
VRIFEWMNIICTPLVVFSYWPNLHHLGSLAFIIVPCWAAFFWLDAVQAAFGRETK